MSKSNKELAIDVAIAAINANHRMPHPRPQSAGVGRAVIPAIGLEDITNIIKSVYYTLEEIDSKSDD